jgi:oligogalacturonide transporter
MYLLFDIVYCFVITPYAALIADMTRDYKERVRLSAFRMGFSQFASVLATSIAPLLLGSFNYSRNGYLVMSIIFAIFFACIWIFVFWGTFELPIPEDKNEFKPNQSKIDNALLFLKELLSTLKNKSFRAQLSMFLLDAAALDMLMIITPILVKDDLMRSDLVPYVSSMWLIQLLVLPFYVHLANKYNKAFTYRVGAMIWILGILSLFLLTKHSVSVFLIICCFGLIGLGLSSCYMIPQSMLSFVVEVDVLISTKSRPGLYAGAMSFCRKFSQAIIILPGIGYLMSMSGYQKGGVIQSPETMFTLKILFILIPVALVIIAFINSYKFCLTPTNFKLMKQEIDRLRDGGKEYPSIEVQQVCEKITGQQYSKLYLAWSK